MSSEVVSKSGAVTFIDVLGWKGIWATQGQTEPIEKLRKIREKVSSSISTMIGRLSDHKEMSGFNTDGIRLLNISDTLIVLTEGDPTANLLIHGEICSEIIVEGIKNGLAMRGATSIGDFSYAENIFLGPAIDEAASWHELTNWIGVILTPSALLKANHTDLGKWKCYHETPYKSGDFKIKNSMVADWTQAWISSGSDLQALNEFCSSKSPLLPEVSKYYLNTIEFYKSQLK